MIRIISIVGILFVFGLKAFTQNVDNGLLWEDDIYETIDTADYYPLSERGGDIPYNASLKKYCPSPSNQGKSASCVGHALANALTILKAKKCNLSPALIDANAHSAAYIFNQIKLDADCRKGAYLSQGLRLIFDEGDCLNTTFENSNNCQVIPSYAHKKDAAKFKIGAYRALFKKEDSQKKRLDQIRTTVANGSPVVVGMKVPFNMKTSTVTELKWSGVPMTGHALVVMGYDETKKEFELMNSYGQDWGNEGFFKLSYDTLIANVRYAYEIELDPNFSCH